MSETTGASRFYARITVAPSGCWIWMGVLNRKGYGTLGSRPAHRLSYAMHVGPIPANLQIDHLCRVRRCVNPMHLQPVTAQINSLRGSGPSGMNSRKERCLNGHLLTDVNLIITSSRDEKRRCRLCENDRNARYRAKKRASSGYKQSCKNGHELVGENLIVAVDGVRSCRACKGIAAAIRWEGRVE
jgi:HNH endonuclease